MKKLILILAIIPTFLFSQGWERTYGGVYSDGGHSVRQTTDGGYIITGYSSSFSNGGQDVYLIKTDSNGDTLWTKSYGDNLDDVGWSVQQTTDGGYVVCGGTRPNNNVDDVYLIKTDSNGDSLWTKTFGGDGYDIGKSVQQTTDGGYIITGITSSFGNGGRDVYLIKTDSDGDSLWTRTYGDWVDENGHSVQQTTDGGYIISGHINSPVNGNGGYLIKTDINGDSLWTKKSWNEYSYYGNCVKQTTDGGYIITGQNGSFTSTGDVCLIKTDINGDTLWTKTYGGDNVDVGWSVQQTTDGGYIISGMTQSFGYEDDFFNVYLIKTDSDGDSLWTRTYGDNLDDVGWSVQQTTDGGYIITGWTYVVGKKNIYLIKTDENGIITSTSEVHFPNPNRKLVKIVDLTGKEITKPIKNQLYIEIYDDGTTKKKMRLK